MSDDFGDFSDGDHDLSIQKHDTERGITEIQNSGYRDGKQAFLEDEKLIQQGFNESYKLFIKYAFQIGQLRHLTRKKCNDNLVQIILDKLEQLEKHPYDMYLDFKNTEMDLSGVKLILDVNQNKLTLFKNLLTQQNNINLSEINKIFDT